MTGAVEKAEIPEGFRSVPIPDNFVELAGPLWVKPEEDGLRVGLPLEPRHGNVMGVAHGGLLVTVADMVMGMGCGFATGMRWPHPTISLNCDFVHGARIGRFLEGKAKIVRRTENFIFARCELTCGPDVVLSAQGVFKVPDPSKIPPAALIKKDWKA